MSLKDIEKVDVADHEDARSEQISLPFDSKLEKDVLRRLDCVVLPIVGMFYLLSIMDRSNLGNARVAGLQKDLHLSDWQYQTAITVTYVPYIMAELPSNLLIAKVGPRILLPTLCVLWGIVTTLQCTVQSFGGLVACRFFLGLCEGGIVPGIMIYLSGFYKRHELQFRVCCFFTFAALSGAFSGLLAAGIVNMDNVGGIRGWRWIFMLEGLFTACFGALTFFIMPNNPSEVLSFKPKHVKCCEDRLTADRVTAAAESKKIVTKSVLSTFASVHIWGLILIQITLGVCFFGLAYFLPSIVATLAKSFLSKPTPVQIQLLTVPPYALAWFTAFAVSFVSDKWQIRGITAATLQLFSIAGFAIFLAAPVHKGGLRYAAIHLVIVGIFASAPSLIVWTPNNVAPYSRRATAIATTFIGTNLGGIMSSWIYPSTSAPSYKLGAQINLSMNIICWCTIVSLMFWFRYQNKRKVQNRDEILKNVQHLSYHEQYEILGDRHPDFKYTI